jgi:glycosyltransferase involved in cell wall biosynthesis
VTPLVSVIVPCRNEAGYIAACVESILATTYPHDRLEVLVVDGRSDDGTRQIVTSLAQRDPVIRLLDNPRRVVPAALNVGIRAARGEIIVRMDGHATYPPDYLPGLVRALQESGADNVGGRIVTLPADGSATARAIAVALAHPFGVGNSYFRIGAPQRRWVDTVCYGCFRRDVFRRVGLFDEELIRNQDDEFNHRLLRAGGRILLAPEVVSYYYGRRTRRQIARMYYQYGYYKPLVVRKVGGVMTLRQLVPPAFLITITAGLIAALVSRAAAAIWLGLIGTYGLAVIGAAAAAIRTRGLRCAAALITVFPVLHLSYGAGYLAGLYRAWVRRGGTWDEPAAVPLSR